MTPEITVAAVIFSSWVVSVAGVFLLLRRSGKSSDDDAGTSLVEDSQTRENEHEMLLYGSTPVTKVGKLRKALERAHEAEFRILKKKRELRTKQDEDNLLRLAGKINELEASLKEATAQASNASLESFEKTIRDANSSRAKHTYGRVEERVRAKEVAAIERLCLSDFQQKQLGILTPTTSKTEQSEFTSNLVDKQVGADVESAFSLNSHLSPDFILQIQLSSELELAELQEKHFEDLLRRNVPISKPRKKKMRKLASETLHHDKEALQAKLEAKREEIRTIREQLEPINERLKLEQIEEEKELERVRLERANELLETITGDPMGDSRVNGRKSSEEVIEEIAQSLRKRAEDLKVQRDSKTAKMKADFKADRELRVLSARAKAISEFEAKRKKAEELNALVDFASAAVAPLVTVARRVQKLSYELDPKLESAHRRMTERLASANQSLRESLAMEDAIEARLKGGASASEVISISKPLAGLTLDAKTEEEFKWSATVSEEFEKLIQEAVDARSQTTELESRQLRQLKLRNLFSEDYLSRVEAVVLRLTVVKDLLEILPGIDKQNRLDFVRAADAVFEFLNITDRSDAEPPAPLIERVQLLEDRVLRQYIRLAKNEVPPLSEKEIKRLRDAGADALKNFASLKLSEQERLDSWQSVCEKVESEGKEFASEIARLRIAQSQRVIKTIDLSTDAVTVVINSVAVSTKT